MSINLPKPRNNKDGKSEKTNNMLTPWRSKRTKKIEQTYKNESSSQPNTDSQVSDNPKYYDGSRDVNNFNVNDYSSNTIINEKQPYEKISKRITKTKSIKKTSANGEMQEATEVDEEVSERIRIGEFNEIFNGSLFGENSIFDGDIFKNSDIFDNNLFTSKQSNKLQEESMYKDAENIIDVEDLQEVQKERTNLNNKEMRCLPHNEESFKCDDEDLSLFKQAIDSAPCSIKDGIFIPNLEDMSIKCLPAKIVFTEEVLSNRKHLEKCLSKVVFICTYNETVPEIRKFKNYIGIGIPFDVEGYCFLNILKESNIPLNIIIERDENNRYFNRYFMDKLMYNHNVVEINKRYSNNTKKSNDDFGIIPFERY